MQMVSRKRKYQHLLGQSYASANTDAMPSHREGRCGAPLMWDGSLTLRPEVDAVVPELETQGYAPVPSWRYEGRWELWTQEGNITSGPPSSTVRT